MSRVLMPGYARGRLCHACGRAPYASGMFCAACGASASHRVPVPLTTREDLGDRLAREVRHASRSLRSLARAHSVRIRRRGRTLRRHRRRA